MRLANTTKVALRALRRHKMRSLLTAHGLIIGVAAVITLIIIKPLQAAAEHTILKKG